MLLPFDNFYVKPCITLSKFDTLALTKSWLCASFDGEARKKYQLEMLLHQTMLRACHIHIIFHQLTDTRDQIDIDDCSLSPE